MKTAISVPDRVFEAAEKLAHQLGVSRSELYTKAVTAFLAQHRRDHITEQLNRVYGEEPYPMDEVIARMQSSSLTVEKW